MKKSFSLRTRSLLRSSVLPVALFLAIPADAQLHITSGSSLVAADGTTIVLNNTGLTNAGNISQSDHTFTFAGTSATSATTLSSITSLRNITVNKMAGGVQLNGNVRVTNIVQLSGGILDLNGFDLNLDAAGSVSGEGSSSYITGTTGGSVLRSVLLNAPSSVNPGNIGLEITSNANLGLTVIKRSHLQQTSGTGHSINRYYDIIPTNNTALNAGIRFFYRDNELAGFTEGELTLYTSADSGVTWMNQGVAVSDTSANYIAQTGLNSLNRLTLGSQSIPLPLTLLRFTGSRNNKRVLLQWETVGEEQIRTYEVERSNDAVHYSGFTSVPSSGKVVAHKYAVSDTRPFDHTTYYRLKVIGADDGYTYSKTIGVAGIYEEVVTIFPNPVIDFVQVQWNSQEEKLLNIDVLNSSGQVVMNRQVNAVCGQNHVSVDVSVLAAGVYYLRPAIPGVGPVRFVKGH